MPVTEINTRKPNPEVIRELEKLLQRARDGELVGLYTLSYWDDGSINNGWHFDERAELFRLLGNAYYAVSRFQAAVEIKHGEQFFVTEDS